VLVVFCLGVCECLGHEVLYCCIPMFKKIVRGAKRKNQAIDRLSGQSRLLFRPTITTYILMHAIVVPWSKCLYFFPSRISQEISAALEERESTSWFLSYFRHSLVLNRSWVYSTQLDSSHWRRKKSLSPVRKRARSSRWWRAASKALERTVAATEAMMMAQQRNATKLEPNFSHSPWFCS
jgi:hypothetical protein